MSGGAGEETAAGDRPSWQGEGLSRFPYCGAQVTTEPRNHPPLVIVPSPSAGETNSTTSRTQAQSQAGLSQDGQEVTGTPEVRPGLRATLCQFLHPALRWLMGHLWLPSWPLLPQAVSARRRVSFTSTDRHSPLNWQTDLSPGSAPVPLWAIWLEKHSSGLALSRCGITPSLNPHSHLLAHELPS